MENEPDNDALELVESLDLSEPIERLRTVGAMKKEFFINYDKDLTAADLAALELPRPRAPRTLQRIHASHHSLARCLAVGMKPSEASLITGYSPDRISYLQGDQAFRGLVAEYRHEAKSVVADATERMNAMSLDAMELLHERMQESPEMLTVPILLDIIKTFADRTGHGPGQEVKLTLERDLIDRPPRETAEEWSARRAKELTGGLTEVKKLN